MGLLLDKTWIYRYYANYAEVEIIGNVEVKIQEPLRRANYHRSYTSYNTKLG